MSAFTQLWLAWLGIFVIIEAIALIRPQRGDTLSETVWLTLKHRPWLKALLATLLVWLMYHFLFER